MNILRGQDPYLGYLDIELSNNELADFYENKLEIPELLKNQYLLIRQSEDQKIVDKYCKQGDELRPLKWTNIKNNFIGLVKPRNFEQELAFDMLNDSSTTVKVLTGQFGCGKTYLMASQALSLLEKGTYEKIVWVRNNVEVKDSEPIGFLKGDFFDKMLPFVMPLADHVGGIEGIKFLMDKQQLEIQHLGFMRGRDIKKSIILVSEAENLTTSNVKLLVGRVGEGRQIWFDGDLQQIDKKAFEKENGLRAIVNSLKGNDLFATVHLNKTERSKTAELAGLIH